jgi:hypothetical protein
VTDTRRRRGRPLTRRTTLTLPVDSLRRAARLARARRVTLSTVISEALAEGLRVNAPMERRKQDFEALKKAFSGFTDDEIAILDGIMLEPAE